MNARLAAALACYGVLALLAGLTLDGKMRLVVWIFLGGLAAKTWLAAAKQRSEP